MSDNIVLKYIREFTRTKWFNILKTLIDKHKNIYPWELKIFFLIRSCCISHFLLVVIKIC